MNETLASEPACPGDGNEDKVVNLDDVANWFYFSTNGVKQPDGSVNTSSWYDFNHDGKTDQKDLKIIVKNFGTNCLKKNKLECKADRPRAIAALLFAELALRAGFLARRNLAYCADELIEVGDRGVHVRGDADAVDVLVVDADGVDLVAVEERVHQVARRRHRRR